MKITKEAQLHLDTAMLLMKGIIESFKANPTSTFDEPKEHSATSVKRRIVQIRQELLRVEKEIDP